MTESRKPEPEAHPDQRTKAGRRTVDRRKIEEIVAAVQRLPTLDNRSADEIIGYDEWGLPS